MSNKTTLNSKFQAIPNLAGRVLVIGGILLVLSGSILAYPYIKSRLSALTIASTVTPSPQHVPPTAIQTASTGTSTPTRFPTRSAASTPTATQVPSPTPTPALPTRIVVPAIDVDAPVEPVSWESVNVNGQTKTAWEVPGKYAAGWHKTSAPLGEPGNTVLNGHNTTHGEVFRDLYTLETGDGIIVYSNAVSYTYTISQTLILPEAGQPLEVRRENARYILPTDDERLTLVTCHPYASLRNRLIVIARPAE